MPSAAAEAAPIGPRPLRTRHTTWRPSRFPPVGLFDRVVDPQDLEAVYALETLTNDRVREETGDLHLLAPVERIAGPVISQVYPSGALFAAASVPRLLSAPGRPSTRMG